MKHLFYVSMLLLAASVFLFLCSCKGGSKLTKEDKEKGAILKGKKHVLTLGNRHKYHKYYESKKEQPYGVLDTAIVTFLPDTLN